MSKPLREELLDGLRNLWCQWDPIGVVTHLDWPKTEYDGYRAKTLERLESGASLEEMFDFLAHCELELMGLSDFQYRRVRRKLFAAGLLDWYKFAKSVEAANKSEQDLQKLLNWTIALPERDFPFVMFSVDD